MDNYREKIIRIVERELKRTEALLSITGVPLEENAEKIMQASTMTAPSIHTPT